MRFDTSKIQVAFTNMDLPSGSGKVQWPIMMEKAWAKVHGAQGNSVGGQPDETFAAIFGAPVEIISHRYYTHPSKALYRWRTDRYNKVKDKTSPLIEIIIQKNAIKCTFEAFWKHPLRKGLLED